MLGIVIGGEPGTGVTTACEHIGKLLQDKLLSIRMVQMSEVVYKWMEPLNLTPDDTKISQFVEALCTQFPDDMLATSLFKSLNIERRHRDILIIDSDVGWQWACHMLKNNFTALAQIRSVTLRINTLDAFRQDRLLKEKGLNWDDMYDYTYRTDIRGFHTPDHILDNNGTLDEFKQQLSDVLETFLSAEVT